MKKQIFKKRFVIIFGAVVLIAGLVMSVPYVSEFMRAKHQLATQKPITVSAPAASTDTTIPTIAGTPSHIEFPSVNISVNVDPGYYNASKGTWTVGPTDAYWATPTAQPNNKTGNTYIYGHNRNQVFTRLLNAQVGDTAILTTSNGYTFTYKLTSLKDVDPSDTGVMDQTVAPTLSVQTCSGVYYQHRRIYTFAFVEVHKNV